MKIVLLLALYWNGGNIGVWISYSNFISNTFLIEFSWNLIFSISTGFQVSSCILISVTTRGVFAFPLFLSPHTLSKDASWTYRTFVTLVFCLITQSGTWQCLQNHSCALFCWCLDHFWLFFCGLAALFVLLHCTIRWCTVKSHVYKIPLYHMQICISISTFSLYHIFLIPHTEEFPGKKLNLKATKIQFSPVSWQSTELEEIYVMFNHDYGTYQFF